jgi:hypothetical protein
MEKALQNKTEKEINIGNSSENDKAAPKERPQNKRRPRRRLPAW